MRGTYAKIPAEILPLIFRSIDTTYDILHPSSDCMDNEDELVAFATGESGSAALSAERQSLADAIDNFNMANSDEEDADYEDEEAGEDSPDQPTADANQESNNPIPRADDTVTSQPKSVSEQEMRDIQEAKSMMQFITHQAKKVRRDRSYVWDQFRKVTISDELVMDLDKLDPKAATMMRNCKDVYSCNICFDDEKVTLGTSLRAATDRQASNLIKHKKKYHEDVVKVQEMKSKKRKVSSITAPSPPSSKKSPADSSVPEQAKGGAKVPTTIEAYFTGGADPIVDEWHRLWVDFATNNNIPVRCVTDHTECPEFWRFLEL